MITFLYGISYILWLFLVKNSTKTYQNWSKMVCFWLKIDWNWSKITRFFIVILLGYGYFIDMIYMDIGNITDLVINIIIKYPLLYYL